MKYLKMLGLAVVAAMAISAFIGAGSASATELCTVGTESPCTNNMMNPGEEISGTLVAGKEAVLTGTFSVKCKKSTIAGKIEPGGTGSSTTTVFGQVETMTFTECGLCSVTVVKKPTLEVHTDTSVADGNGNLTALGFEVSINCLGVVCEYGGNIEEKITVDGGKTAKITALGAPVPVTGGTEKNCGKKGEWDAEYEVTKPDGLWVV